MCRDVCVCFRDNARCIIGIDVRRELFLFFVGKKDADGLILAVIMSLKQMDGNTLKVSFILIEKNILYTFFI